MMLSPIIALLDNSSPTHIRLLRTFVETEVRIPDGPRKGDLFGECPQPPWVLELLTAMTDERWSEVWMTGPRQTGKTLTGNTSPLLYHLFEIGEDIICLVPEMRKAEMIWKKKILPVIKASHFAHLLPKTGKGSRGGQFDIVMFENGASLHFMGAGGQDPPSSATARVVLVTEANEMRESATGDQGNPVDAVRMCSASFIASGNARLYGESIITTDRCITWEAITKSGTDTKVMLRCPHCGTFQYPERERLVGWKEATSPIEACAKVRYACSGCAVLWTEEDRTAAIAAAVLVHGGQSIDRAGVITGPAPQTRVLGVRWNAMCHPLRTMADCAEKEWNARMLGTENAEKSLCQYTWAQPFVAKVSEREISNRHLSDQSKLSMYHKREVPSWATFLTAACDVQKNRHYWQVMAHGSDNRWAIVDWGFEFLLPKLPDGTYDQGYEPTETDRIRVMDQIAGIMAGGWPVQGSPDQRMAPVAAGIDTGYLASQIIPWVAAQPEWVALKGVGVDEEGRKDGARVTGASVLSPELGDRMAGVLNVTQPATMTIQLWHVMGSPVRRQLHSALMRVPGSPGSGMVPKGLPANESLLLHLTAEIWTQDPAKLTWYWRIARANQNHLLDCAVYNLAMGMFHRAYLDLYPAAVPTAPPPKRAPDAAAEVKPFSAPTTTPDGRPYLLSDR